MSLTAHTLSGRNVKSPLMNAPKSVICATRAERVMGAAGTRPFFVIQNNVIPTSIATALASIGLKSGQLRKCSVVVEWVDRSEIALILQRDASTNFNTPAEPAAKTLQSLVPPRQSCPNPFEIVPPGQSQLKGQGALPLAGSRAGSPCSSFTLRSVLARKATRQQGGI
jgi:hypothetical protein